MHILVLSSVFPDHGHFRAAQTVLAVLLDEFIRLGHRVSLATVCAGGEPSTDMQARWRHHMIDFAGDFTSAVDEAPAFAANAWRRRLAHLGEFVAPLRQPDYPRFRAPAEVAAALARTGADAALLFWDTWFDHLLPALREVPIFGYLARPRSEASLARLDGMYDPVRRAIQRARLLGWRRRHIARSRRLRKAVNICALDAAWYRQQGVDCNYLSNTWPDAFGPNWQSIRAAAEAKRRGVEILGNIGGLDATGNRFGLHWLADNVLHPLQREMNGLDWRINICGRHTLPAELAAALAHPRIALRGFVPDIDDEMAGNRLFLLLNNAGPYTGGYTRVIYAMASGACLVAHRRLALSMPELVHDQNFLLGETGPEIAALIAGAARDNAQRGRIGERARQTYETAYAPRVVAASLARAMQDALGRA
ncbi:MAG: glycosyltransferase [Proteobacteria bacterium]|nr:glycosyltransferase [Pseudomonadota bacterium]